MLPSHSIVLFNTQEPGAFSNEYGFGVYDSVCEHKVPDKHLHADKLVCFHLGLFHRKGLAMFFWKKWL